MLITVDDVRREQVVGSEIALASDDQVAAAIELAQAYIDHETRQSFRPVFYDDAAPLLIDGSGVSLLQLPIPILSLLKVLEDGDSVDLTALRLYNRVGPMADDRFNPKIVKTATATLGFGGVGGRGILRAPIWQAEQLSVGLVGWFGFVENDCAWLDLKQNTVNVRTVLQAAVAGPLGNANTIRLLGDGGAKPVSVTSSALATTGGILTGGTAYTFHYQPGVSTVQDFENAVAAQPGLSIKKSASVYGAQYLTGPIQAADAMPATSLASSPPPLIKKTALRIVLRYWRLLTDMLERQDRQTGQVVSESTDGHSYSLSGVIITAGFSGDPAIDDVLAMYRRTYGATTRGPSK